ncbi:radical SAM protein [Bradyrhizobium quebecense]|uniref:Radical SAM protein n=2 Tax=Bradyrhizobium quebecense TaxID=2748629 RepID=A0ABS3MTL9_9BRAD|nr:radical SAM protein [Bradyrhizobium quebecense]UGY02538.1 radical SAM protein [Bradyrhizobium quebecense]
MSVEVRPLGVKCNISCHYCYQNSIRTMGGNAKEYDLDQIKEAVLAKGGPFALFGGEPLLMPLHDLADLFAWGFERFGSSSIQTNAVLLTDEHIKLFKRFKVGVGVSIDGPDECNSARWAGSVVKTSRATAKIERALETLLSCGIRPSVITTLNRFNATAAMLPRLIDWFRFLDRIGIPFARIHLLEVDSSSVRESLALSESENASAMLALGELERKELKTLKFDMFREIKALLLANDKEVSCVWRACDAYATEAVQGIEGHGEASNCGRTNKAGVDYVKADANGFERYLALYWTPQEHGGCKDCRFFLMCKGQCPGTSIDGDWRNRTEHCGVWFRLFEHVETLLCEDGYVPVSQDRNRLALEGAMLAEWAQCRNPTLTKVLERMRVLAFTKPTVDPVVS